MLYMVCFSTIYIVLSSKNKFIIAVTTLTMWVWCIIIIRLQLFWVASMYALQCLTGEVHNNNDNIGCIYITYEKSGGCT